MKKMMVEKMEFSKKIFVGITTMVIVVVLFSMYMMVLTQDTSPLAYLIPSVFVEFATATAFYYKKAEHENLIKIERGTTDE